VHGKVEDDVSPEQVELVEQYLEDTIEAAGASRLVELLGDPAFRTEFAEMLRMNGLLRAGIGPDAACERLAEIVSIGIPSRARALDSAVMEQIRERGLRPDRRRRWARVAVIAAAGWAVALGLWIAFREPPVARIVAASAEVDVEREARKTAGVPGFALRTGDTLNVPLNGWARVQYEDATTLQIGPDTRLTIEGEGLPLDPKRVYVKRGVVSAEVSPQPTERPMMLLTPHAITKVIGTTFTLTVGGDSTRILVRSGRVGVVKAQGDGAVEVAGGQAATAARGRPLAAESIRRTLLRTLGKDHFMLGIMSELGEKWIDDTRPQGCRWDLRYQHLGVDWTRWNKDGAFVPMYLQESDRLGALTVFTYYALVKTKTDSAAMKKYFTDVRTFMQKAGGYGKPVVLHVEPSPRPSGSVAVGSAGLPELEGLEDSADSIGRAFARLRDCHAPNVLLAGHVPKGQDVPAGSWDLLFTEVGDRDAGFREARGTADAWWQEKDFVEFRDWAAQLHAKTGLPLMLWRIPLGNTVMASCNNKPWHYMDNRVEYWLENYPSNRRISEWADAGFLALLFGGGTHECTVHRDSAKDGVTNPPPVEGNKGERSSFSDDDGGYLRLRAGEYYKRGSLKLSPQ
jgi:hypothetical protein